MPTSSMPTKQEVEKTILRLTDLLTVPAINRIPNHVVRAGYTEAIRILENRIMLYENISPMDSDQSMFIAGLAVDYLRGDETAENLLRVPIRRGKIKATIN